MLYRWAEVMQGRVRVETIQQRPELPIPAESVGLFLDLREVKGVFIGGREQRKTENREQNTKFA